MMHGSAASVSAASNNGTAAALQKPHRRPSRSNSLSSSSVVTVKRTGSRSSSTTGTRGPTVPMRPQSPAEPSLIALRVGRDRPAHEHKRRKSVAPDVASPGENEGMNNLNRWSHSTNSSVTSVSNTKGSRATSGAALQTLASQHFSPPKWSQTAGREQSPKASSQRRPQHPRPGSQRRLYSPEPGTNGRRHPSHPDRFTPSLTALPPLYTTPSLTDPNDTESPSTTQTLQTPSTQSSSYSHSYAHDYFGDDGVSPRSTAESNKPILIRNNTAPMSAPAPGQQRAGKPEVPPEQLRRTHTSQALDNATGGGSSSWHGHSRRRSSTRETREKEKKAMLSKALQKANTAVLLDNAQNFEGALDAYSDACRLLQSVMDRSSGLDDKRKLEAIRVTYTNRIEELRQLDMSRPSTADGKDLPARPMSDDSISLSPTNTRSSMIETQIRNSAFTKRPLIDRTVDTLKLASPTKDRDSFFSRAMEAVAGPPLNDGEAESSQTRRKPEIQRSDAEQSVAGVSRETEDVSRSLHLPPPEEGRYMPAALSPRRPSVSEFESEASSVKHEPENLQNRSNEGYRDRAESNDNSVSWLDTIDESVSDCASSVHSKSHGALHRKRIRHASNETDPDFDAAFDAAVEAAYDEGFEPDTEALRRLETVRKHANKESITVPSSAIKEVLSPTADFQPQSSSEHLELDDDEEERLLDEITSDYAQGFNFDLSSKSSIPRQSDSSGYSRSTWQSSRASVDRTTAATSLSTVEEDTLSMRSSQKLASTPASTNTVRADQPPPSAPPLTALPAPPNRSSGVRSRRMSGANTKQLKIETATSPPESRQRASTFHHSPSPRYEDEKSEAFDRDFKFASTLETTPSEVQHENILTSPPTLELRSAASDVTRPQTAVAADKRRSLDDQAGDLLSPRPNLFRKNKSSVSLREHTVLLASPELDSAQSIVTPMSSTFMAYSARRNQDPLTSQRAKFSSFDAGYNSVLHAGGVHLFDTSLSSNQPPMSPRSPGADCQPVGLEPCPESFLLRPFWLMRVIGSTLTHPKGGFLTTRLFVPQEVWHTRGVKLKSLEDKVANCDLLTAALGQLASVDTYDADAVMNELQRFEEVMERVQGALAKKLGNDVGLNGVSGIFRDGGSAPPGASNQTASDASAKNSKESKSYLNSWRKLRSKSSGTPLSAVPPTPAKEKELPLASVPMTSFVPVERRGGANKKNARNLTFEGPQKDYMGSLARLFEGAQVLDQIARQVEDPGLRHSSPTHVGLELSMRHAAEFFGFYICRFVLADVGTLLDKFVKRGTEWVLA